MVYKICTLQIALASVTVACLVANFLTPLTVLGLADFTPTQHYTTAYNGDAVKAIAAASDGSFYVAGGFNNYARSYGNAVLASASTGFSESPFPDVDGDVLETISDGAGGWYIGGSFNRVGSLQRTSVAHINADGTPDEDFEVDIVTSTPAVFVHSLALDEDDGILYVGGDFGVSGSTTFSGVTVSGMAALNALDGTPVVGFSQPVMSFVGDSAIVYALELDNIGGFIYVGGAFDTIGNATTRNNLVSFNGDTGATTSFDPNTNDAVLALAMDATAGDIYAGGVFTMVDAGSTSWPFLALFDSTTGAVNMGFTPNPNGNVSDMAIDAGVDLLYIGGAFTDLDGDIRNRLAAVDMFDGVAEPFDPDLDGTVLSIALNSDGSTLYATGGFTTVNGGSLDRDRAAAFDTSDGDATEFSQSTDRLPYSVSLSEDEESVLIGLVDGANYSADEGATFGLNIPILHIMPDGSVDPAFSSPAANGQIYTLVLSPDETTLYAGGDFTLVNGVDRNGIAAFDADTGIETDFDPDLNAGANALVLSSDGGILYAGGSFSNANQTTDSVTRNHLAAFDTAAVDPTDNATAFDPDMDSDVYALALSPDDSTLYAGGGFTTVNGTTPRNYLAAFDTDGIATGFNPDLDNLVYALALSEDEETVYAGGEFTLVNGALPRNYAAAFDATMGVATAFDTDANSTVRALVFGPDGVLYMGGDFVLVNGDDHNHLVAVDADTGEADSDFDLDDDVWVLAHGGVDGGLLAGGTFRFTLENTGGVAYVVTNQLAHFTDTGTPPPTPSSGNRTGGYWVGFSQPPAPGRDPANLAHYGLREGDTISADGLSGEPGFDPDIYIVNEHGYKRLFLNPVIFNFYGHLGWDKVKKISAVIRDAFATSGLFRNCETGDQRVFAVEVTGEDKGTLHHVQLSDDAAVAQDADFFKKVFCVNNNEFNWYPKSPTPYTSLGQMPVYRRPGQ